MSQIDALLEKLAPKGVPIRPMGEVGAFTRGRRFTKADRVADGLPSIHYGEIYTHYGVATTDIKSHVRTGLEPALRFAEQGDVIIAAVGETVEDVGKSVAWLGNGRVAVHDDCFIFRSPLDPKFVAYFTQSDAFNRPKEAFVSRAKVKRLSSDGLARIYIPVPPLEVQREIVKRLDQFTTLETELEAELEARRIQYQHYATVLIANDDEVPRVQMGDVATIVRGASPRPIQSFITAAEDGVPWIKIGDVPSDGKFITGTAQRVTPAGAAKSRRVRPGDFVLSNSMSFGRPYISRMDGCIHDGWLAISGFEKSFVPDYLYYLLRSAPVQAEFERRAGAGTVKNLNAEIVRSVLVPVPSRSRQEQVVGLLNRFDALINDPSSGLPAELSARRKQYEHYRDRLLTFQEAPA